MLQHRIVLNSFMRLTESNLFKIIQLSIISVMEEEEEETKTKSENEDEVFTL